MALVQAITFTSSVHHCHCLNRQLLYPSQICPGSTECLWWPIPVNLHHFWHPQKHHAYTSSRADNYQGEHKQWMILFLNSLWRQQWIALLYSSNLPCSFVFNQSLTFTASWLRIGPDKVHQSGTTPPGIHFWMNKCICGLFAEFHGAQITIRSLQKSLPNSDCMAGVHDGLPERGESLNVLNMHLHLGSDFVIKGVDSNKGLRRGDGVARMEVPGHAVEPVVDTCIEWDQLFECMSWWGCMELSAAVTSAFTAWHTVWLNMHVNFWNIPCASVSSGVQGWPIMPVIETITMSEFQIDSTWYAKHHETQHEH